MRGLLLVNYHYIQPAGRWRHPGIHPLTPEAFEAQVEMLCRRLNPATPEEVEAFADGARLARPSFFLTFDDGLAEHARIAAPVLERHGLRGAFFVCSRPLLERRATVVQRSHWLRATPPPAKLRAELMAHLPPEWATLEDDAEGRQAANQVNVYDAPEIARVKYLMNFRLPYPLLDRVTAEMLAERGVDEAALCRDFYMDETAVAGLAAAGHVVGSHAPTHRPLSRMPAAECDAELERNRACLAGITGGAIDWLSYPWGSTWSIPPDAAAVCRRHGFRLAITLNRAWNTGGEEAALLNRVNTNEVDRMLPAEARQSRPRRSPA